MLRRSSHDRASVHGRRCCCWWNWGRGCVGRRDIPRATARSLPACPAADFAVMAELIVRYSDARPIFGRTPERDAPKPICRRRSASLSGIWTRQDPAAYRWSPAGSVVAGEDLAKDFGLDQCRDLVARDFPRCRRRQGRRTPEPPHARAAARQSRRRQGRRTPGPPHARAAARRQAAQAPGLPSLPASPISLRGVPDRRPLVSLLSRLSAERSYVG
jgi:hypothetical protein